MTARPDPLDGLLHGLELRVRRRDAMPHRIAFLAGVAAVGVPGLVGLITWQLGLLWGIGVLAVCGASFGVGGFVALRLAQAQRMNALELVRRRHADWGTP